MHPTFKFSFSCEIGHLPIRFPKNVVDEYRASVFIYNQDGGFEVRRDVLGDFRPRKEDLFFQPNSTKPVVAINLNQPYELSSCAIEMRTENRFCDRFSFKIKTSLDHIHFEELTSVIDKKYEIFRFTFPARRLVMFQILGSETNTRLLKWHLTHFEAGNFDISKEKRNYMDTIARV